jgi:hypothetical protein
MGKNKLHVTEKSSGAQLPLKFEKLIVVLEREKIWGNKGDKPGGVKGGHKT